MRVEFVKDWQRFRVGQFVDHLSGGVVDALTRTRIVRPAPMAAAPGPPTDPAPGTDDEADPDGTVDLDDADGKTKGRRRRK